MAIIKETFTRDQLNGPDNPESNESLAGRKIMQRLRSRGVPAIGILGVLGVEWGKLTIVAEDGLDGDEWTWTYEGPLMPQEWIDKTWNGHKCLKLDKSLTQRIAEEDEL